MLNEHLLTLFVEMLAWQEMCRDHPSQTAVYALAYVAEDVLTISVASYRLKRVVATALQAAVCFKPDIWFVWVETIAS